jgi:hypothetical protein
MALECKTANQSTVAVILIVALSHYAFDCHLTTFIGRFGALSMQPGTLLIELFHESQVGTSLSYHRFKSLRFKSFCNAASS